MPDHVHLFAAFPLDGIALPSWVQSLRNAIGKRLLQLGIPKPHWQEGFFDHLGCDAFRSKKGSAVSRGALARHLALSGKSLCFLYYGHSGRRVGQRNQVLLSLMALMQFFRLSWRRRFAFREGVDP